MSADETLALDAERPWPGLLPFTEQGQGFFHGRDDEIVVTCAPPRDH